MDQQNEPRKKALFIPFSISLPITQVTKSGDLFGTTQTGTIEIFGRGRVDPQKINGLPIEFADHEWLTIDIASVIYNSADLLPILNGLPAARPLRESFEAYVKGQCITIYNAKFAK